MTTLDKLSLSRYIKKIKPQGKPFPSIASSQHDHIQEFRSIPNQMDLPTSNLKTS